MAKLKPVYVNRVPVVTEPVVLAIGARDPNAVYCDEPSITIQSAKDECDINLIVARASVGADVSHVNMRVAQYGDFSNVPSYQDALALVTRANGMFMSMDAKVRERFGNEPSRMVSFLQDPSNRDEAIRLGLVVDTAKVAADAAAAASKGPQGPAVVSTPAGAV